MHFRELSYHAFRRSQNASETVWSICLVYSNDAIAKSSTQAWFRKFENGIRGLCAVRPSEFDNNYTKVFLRKDDRQTT